MNYTLRLLPCSKYENEVMESWLEDLALQGLVLENIVCGVAIFKKQEPQKLRYRLSVIPAEKWDVFEEVSGEDELIEICEASGWKYICKRGLFGIFMTADEKAEELHTEPELQYLDFKDYLDWRALLWPVVWFFIILDNFRYVIILQDISNPLGTEELLLIVALLLLTIATLFLAGRDIISPRMLYRKIKVNGIQHNRVTWKRQAMCYRLFFILLVIIFASGFGYAFYYSSQMFSEWFQMTK